MLEEDKMLYRYEDIRELKRKSYRVFFGIYSLGVVKSWGLLTYNNELMTDETIVVSYDNLIINNRDMVQFTNAEFVYSLPEGPEEDEYLILFIEKQNCFKQYIESRLVANMNFSRLIEKKLANISANSTKLITILSLRDILENFNSIKIDRGSWSKLASDLDSYVESLIRSYPYLGYLSVIERREFRKKSTADVSYAWEFYFKYFIDQWKDQQYSEVIIPNLSMPFEYNGWTGDFFDRDNPLLKEHLNSNSKYLFNITTRELLYKIWKEWIKGA